MKKYVSMFICVLFLLSITFTNSVFAAEVYESENNDDFSTANTILADATIIGRVSHDYDNDTFKVTLSSSSTLNIILSGTYSVYNYSLYLYDSSGNIAGSYEYYGSSKKISQALTAGTYYIKVIYFSNYDPILSYNLSITGIPAKTSEDGGNMHGGDMYEYNDSFSRATNISASSFIISEANIHPLGDTDYYKFSVTQNISAVLTIAAPYPELRYYFKVYDSNYNYVASGGGTGELKVNLVRGTYYIKVYGVDSESVLKYRLKMTTTP